jgi:hypothetical protein
MVLGTANLTMEMAVGSQLSVTAARGICEQVAEATANYRTDAHVRRSAGRGCMVILANSAATNCEADRRDVLCHQSKGFRETNRDCPERP